MSYLDVELRGNIENELGMDGFPFNHNHFPVPTSAPGVGDVITLNTTKEDIIARLLEIKRTREGGQKQATPVTV